MAKKRKAKKSTVKRSKKRSTRDVDVFTPNVSDEALERAAAGSHRATLLTGACS